MSIELNKDARAAAIQSIERYFRENMDEPIGNVAASGLLMFATQPAELLANRAFILKLALVQLAGLNAVAFHSRDGLERCDRVARAQTVLSTGLWLGAIASGRWIAYL